MANLTKRQAVKAYNALVAALGEVPQAGTFRQGEGAWPSAPVLVENYGSWSTTSRWAIVWEEGPFEWALRPGWDQDVRDAIPDGVFAEPIESFSLGLYPA